MNPALDGYDIYNKIIQEEMTMSDMQKYECPCGYIYDPAEGDWEHGVDPGTPFADVPADWVCPLCGLGKEDFYKH